MFDFTHYINTFLGISAIFLQIVSFLTLFLLFFSSKNNKYLSFIKENFIVLGFLFSFLPMLCSLFYSEILNYAPCFHCWIQRIFLFPQVFIFAVAWIRKDKNVWWYSLPLTLLGIFDAVYLNYIYYFNQSAGDCDASGVSCVKRLVSVFDGYISIPSLALTSFFVLLSILLVARFYNKEN